MQSSSLAMQLLGQLQGAPIQQMAKRLGVDEHQTHGAVAMALPLLLGALGRNAQDSQGAQDLFGALQHDHLPQAALQSGGLDLGGVLSALLGAGGGSAGGDAILGHIFGAGRSRVEAGLGQASGLGEQVGPLLQMLAPIVMSFLAQRVLGNGMDASSLGEMLAQERTQDAGGGVAGVLGGLLDQDGDGQLGLGDLLKLGGGLLGGRR